jgi:hypothetical protein
MNLMMPLTCGTDTVAELPRRSRETRRLSDGHVEGAAVAWRRADAIDAKLKFGNVRKRR